MRMSISRKLIGGFLCLAFLVLIAGLVGIVVLNKVSSSADTVAKGKAPAQYAVMNAARAVDSVQKNTLIYQNASFNLEEIGARVDSGMEEFDMWLAMLKHGTAAETFRNGPYQAIYQAKNLKVVVPPGSEAMLATVQNLFDESKRLKVKTADLMAAKKTFNGYGVKVGDRLLDLPAFLNMAQLDHLDWLRQLKDAVNIETKFEGNTDPAKDLIGEWLNSYQVPDEELMVFIGKFREQYAKLLSIAEKINGMPSFKEKQRALNRSISTTARIERYFIDLHAQAKKVYSALEADRQKGQDDLADSVEKINTHLGSLIAIAAQEMRAALAEAETAKKRGVTLLIVLTVVAVMAAGILGTLFSRFMSVKILSIAESTKKIASGDLQKDLQVKSNDELGDLAGDTNQMIANLRQIIGQILSFAGKISTSAVDLAGVSRDFDQDAAVLSTRSKEASDATTTMSVSMQEISALANDSKHRVQNIAIATEEMSSTITEIARNTEQARTISGQAVATVENTTLKMNELSMAANEIGKVADVIINIADQTNLLSLNATIEAARAGEAGRGFAVVANEVKELASQTNTATGDIRQKIYAIQKSSAATIEEITEITKIIDQINSIVVVIAGAVEEQAVTTRQITEDINSVSGGIEGMTMHVNSATEISGTVASDIGLVSTTSKNISQGSGYIQESAADLEKLAGELNRLVGQFKV